MDDPDWRLGVQEGYRNENPLISNLFDPLERDADPLWALRIGLEQAAGHGGWVIEDHHDPVTGGTARVTRDWADSIRPIPGIYSARLDATKVTLGPDPLDAQLISRDLLGFSCFLPDAEIPGSAAHERAIAKLMEGF